jgi:hypothetical protein
MRHEERQDRMEARSGIPARAQGKTDGLDEIREALDKLERYCHKGAITPLEFAEEREMLEAQRDGLRRAH